MPRLLYAFVIVWAGLWAFSEPTSLEQRIYLPKCTGAWYMDSQGSQDGADWALLKCNDQSSEAPDTPTKMSDKLRGPVLFQTEPIGVQRQIELWRIERAEDYERNCTPEHTWDRCHAIPNTL